MSRSSTSFLFHLMLGPWLAALTTNNMTEWPAVWCLFSIGLLAIAFKTPIRRVLYVRQWRPWPRSWRSNAAAARGSHRLVADRMARLDLMAGMPLHGNATGGPG
jgi:hypothetical protein